MRAFVALDLPTAHKQVLSRHLDRWKAEAPGFRWTPHSNLHLTLRFLGYLEPGVLAALRAGLRSVEAPPFTIALGELGTFGPRFKPRVVWLGLSRGGEACAELAAKVEQICQQAGLAPEARAFHPHVTLARAAEGRGGALPDLSSPPELAPWTVEAFVLFESRLGRPSPVYVPLEAYPLS